MLIPEERIIAVEDKCKELIKENRLTEDQKDEIIKVLRDHNKKEK